MIETNIRIVAPGLRLYLWTREVRVSGPRMTQDIMEKACAQLRRRHALVAMPYSDDPPTLLVVARSPIKAIHLEDPEWELDVIDSGNPQGQLTWESPDGKARLASLIERLLLAQVETRTSFWSLDSPRIWYEATPFIEQDGISVYRRYEFGTLPIDTEGIGISVDVGTAFLSSENLTYFLNPDLSLEEQKQREELFLRLTGRQDGQKGTLVYDNGRTKSKCYFESAPRGMTCATTGSIQAKNRRYDTLLDYYRAEYPDLPISPDSLAIRASFPGLEYPQPIAADLVHIRVMNESVPPALRSVDKISPERRRHILLRQFWALLGSNPLGEFAPGIEDGLWRPRHDQVVRFGIPSLTYGKQQVLASPSDVGASLYKENFRQRLRMLKQAGCYRVPPNIARTIYCAFPRHLDEKPAQQLASDLLRAINGWIGRNLQIQLVPYDSVNDAVEKLREFRSAGMAVFVLNNEPRAYYEAAFQLSNWRIKRITEDALNEHYRYLVEGIYDRRTATYDRNGGVSRWRGFINMNALDIIQQLDVVPYRVDQIGPYEAQLIIDVGFDKRHFALSLVIARSSQKSPDFHIVSHVFAKTDKQREGINPVALKDAIVELLSERPRHFDPIESLLVIRDGKIVEKEPSGLAEAIAELTSMGLASRDMRLDVVEVHKDTLKYIRFWNVTNDGKVENPLLGTAIRLDSHMVVLATTGSPTLGLGTAEPILILGDGSCADVLEAARANFEGAQLNWSSPTIAQKLHVGLKRTDDDLKVRDAQEIRRYR